jgi:hypothetical protein
MTSRLPLCAALLAAGLAVTSCGIEVTAAPGTTGGQATPVDLAAVHGVGVDAVPVELLDGSAESPTGQALATVMQQDGVQLVRLAWGNQYASRMDDGGWKVAFDRLEAAHIDVLLTLHQQPPGASQGPGVSNATITDLGSLVTAEEGVLSAIKSQFGGTYPANLVALDVFNEPVLNSSTVSSLRQLADDIRTYSAGIPVTIGGWRSAGQTVEGAFNQPSLAGLAASIGDFVSVHLYPDNNTGGGGLSTTDPAEITPYATQYLSTAISQIDASGHTGMPILITETGGQNGQAPGGGFHQDISGSPAHQEATLAAVLEAAEQFPEVRGVLDWWITPPPGESCNGSALICFDGTYTSPALPLLAQNQFS